MRMADVNLIEVPERQRRAPMNEEKLAELKTSIKEGGLLHPIVVYKHPTIQQKYILVAGGRRLTVYKQLAEEGVITIHDGWEYPAGKIPITLLNNPTETRIAVAELEENLFREDLNWVDVDRALAQIHELKLSENPSQTVTETANDLFTRGTGPQSKNANALRVRIGQARIVAQHLDDPEIAKSRNSTEAYRKILQRGDDAIAARLRQAAIKDSETSGLPAPDFRLGDALEILPKMPANEFDLVLTDPPYGIGAHSAGYRSRGEHSHEYDDTLTAAKKFLPQLLLELWRVTRLRANLFLFTDIQHWEMLQETSSAIGWVPFRTPIIWNKAQNEGQRPWNINGPYRTYEVIFFATKGQKGLYYPIPDILSARRVLRSKKILAAQKPHDLLRQLVQAASIEGDHVLDPCAGSGSTLRTSRLMHRRSTGIELNEATYNAGMNFIFAEKEEDENDPTITLEDV